MKVINASKFKEQCLSILDHLVSEGIIISKHGKPVAKLIPIRNSNSELIGCMKNKIIIHGDIMSTGEKWDAES